MWTYEQATGRLLCDGVEVAVGYSGRGAGKNNPAMEDVHHVGPIPRGVWVFGDAVDTETHGPRVLRLKPGEETDTFGRSGFLIHGDNPAHPGESSYGCIVLERKARWALHCSGVRLLEVV